jgi:hypothetical protein
VDLEQVLVWLERREYIDIDVEGSIAVHEDGVGPKRHAFPSWAERVPGELENHWLHGGHSSKCSFFKG